MDVETTRAFEALDSRIDRLHAEMKDEFASVRVDMAGLRETVETNWTRTKMQFETLRGDVQMLAGHVADLASRFPPR